MADCQHCLAPEIFWGRSRRAVEAFVATDRSHALRGELHDQPMDAAPRLGGKSGRSSGCSPAQLSVIRGDAHRYRGACRIAVVGGGAVLAAMLVSAIQFDPSVMALAVAAVLGGIVAGGSNRSTAKEAVLELTTAEAKRNALIEQIDLRLVPDREGLQ